MTGTSARLPVGGPLLPGEDLTAVYPEEEKVPESELQGNARHYVQGALSIRYQERPDVYVAGDMFVYYRMNDAEARLAPDVMVVFGAAESPPRPSWRVWREGGLTPDFVLEIASPGTVADDAGWKRDRYAAMEVSDYWRFDPQGGELMPELLTAEVLDAAGEYRPLSVARDTAGMLRGHSALLGLDLCVVGSELRPYDPVAGEWLRSHAESEAAARSAEAAQAAAEASIAQLEARLRAAGIDPA